LNERKNKLLLDNPALNGLSPLYADYDAACWWWQILNFFVTLLLCGPVLLLPAEAASQVFIQLFVSTAMAVALANKKPYLHSSDDLLAQLCQVALSFAMAVGLLEMAATSFQDQYYGPILIVCTTVQFLLGFIAAFVEWVKAKMPRTVSKLEAFFTSWSAIETTDIVTSRRLNPALVQQSRRKTNAVVPEGLTQTPHTEGTIQGNARLGPFVRTVSETSTRKSSTNPFSNATSVVPVDLNDNLPGLNIGSGTQAERVVEAPSPSALLQGPPGFKKQLKRMPSAKVKSIGFDRRVSECPPARWEFDSDGAFQAAMHNFEQKEKDDGCD
jgi:hypothetical protein